jgi:uncharacterized membrane protein
VSIVVDQPEAPAEPESQEPESRQLGRLRLPRIGFYQAIFWVYLVLAMLIFALLVPPFQKPDEPAHWHRAVSLTNLDFVCQKDSNGEHYFEMKRKYADLPDVVHVWEVAFNYKVKFDPHWRQEDFSKPIYDEPARIYRFCSLPSPGYLPNSLGVLLGKPLENPLWSFYFGRIFGGLFFLGAVIVALKVTPDRYKLIVYGYAALPVVLHQVTALNYDAVHLSLFILAFAYLTKFIVEGGPIRRTDLLIFMGLLLWTINVRLLTWFPFVLLFFVIRPAQIASQRSRYFAVAGAFMSAAVATTVLFTVTYLERAEDSSPDGVGIDSNKQLQYVLDHPWHFVQAFYKTLQTQGDLLLREMIGVFGWVDYGFSFLPYYGAVFLGGLLVYYIASRDMLLLRRPQIAMLFVTIAATACSVFFSLYLVWSAVGDKEIRGLQGRYFVGLLPFALLGFSQLTDSVGRGALFKVGAAVLAVVVLYNIFRAVDLRYY